MMMIRAFNWLFINEKLDYVCWIKHSKLNHGTLEQNNSDEIMDETYFNDRQRKYHKEKYWMKREQNCYQIGVLKSEIMVQLHGKSY